MSRQSKKNQTPADSSGLPYRPYRGQGLSSGPAKSNSSGGGGVGGGGGGGGGSKRCHKVTQLGFFLASKLTHFL